MKKFLSELIDQSLPNDIEVSGISLDSRTIKPGELFLAYVGTEKDGRAYIQNAIKNGAVAIFAEPGECSQSIESLSVPVYLVENLNKNVGKIASKFYSAPSKKLKVVGVTGTNGKTSCTHFIGETLKLLKKNCGIIGTLGVGVYGDELKESLTTPDAVTLQKTLFHFVEKNILYVAMEVSSHSLDQNRVACVDFEIAIFTNLTRDHLDYHKTFAAYGNAKKKLFIDHSPKYSVINIDDPFGKSLLQDLDSQNVFTYSLQKNDVNFPKIYCENIIFEMDGMQVNVVTPWGKGKFKTQLLGKFNLSNLLSVLTTLCILGDSFHDVLEIISQLKSVDGRMQCLKNINQPLVVIDYAHSPDSLEKVLQSLRQHCAGKLFCVFGCGGNRDKGKRPQMARISEKFADKVFLTNDNPRYEDPSKIFDDIMQGFVDVKKVVVEENRNEAIKLAIQNASENDIVLVAGKGAEKFQYICDLKIPLSDLEIVRGILNC